MRTPVIVGACLLSALAGGLIGHARLDNDLATQATTVKAPVVTEDDWRWNCLTMGNRHCGPRWVPVSDDLDNLLDAVERPDQWQRCVTWNDGEVDLVACPDDRPVVAL